MDMGLMAVTVLMGIQAMDMGTALDRIMTIMGLDMDLMVDTAVDMDTRATATVVTATTAIEFDCAVNVKTWPKLIYVMFDRYFK